MCLCYCIGYTSDNEWYTSEIPLNEYQEKLRKRREEALLEGIHTHTSLLYHNCVLIVHQALNFPLHDDKVHK